jgi:hypothetical protein
MDYTIEHVINLVSDPFVGPFEGEDFFVDDHGMIQVTENNVKTAALIMRKVNTSGIFPKKLVKIGRSGDSILLGFDTLSDAESVYSDNVGPNNETNIQVKKDTDGKFVIYVNQRRSARPLKSMTAVKKFIRTLDQELRQVFLVPDESLDE